MDAVKYSIKSGHVGFVKAFTELRGINKMITIRTHPMRKIVLAGFDVIPEFFKHEFAIEYMGKRQELFLKLYEDMESQDEEIR